MIKQEILKSARVLIKCGLSKAWWLIFSDACMADSGNEVLPLKLTLPESIHVRCRGLL